MATETKHTSRVSTDHEEIQQWAEERGAKPACVRGTGGKGDIGMLRLDFPGFNGEDSLEHITWDEWFEKFDERHLALLFQEETAAVKRATSTRSSAVKPPKRWSMANILIPRAGSSAD